MLILDMFCFSLQLNSPEDGVFKMKQVGECIQYNTYIYTYALFVNKCNKFNKYMSNAWNMYNICYILLNISRFGCSCNTTVPNW